MEKQKEVFRNFAEFWHYTRNLLQEQRDVIFHSLPYKQQKKIERSYKIDGWEDLFMHNKIDEIVDNIKKELKVDVIYMRCKVIMGKSYYMKRSMWEYLVDIFNVFPNEYTWYVIGGMEAVDVGENAVRIIPSQKK
jgi:hypothetical protein